MTESGLRKPPGARGLAASPLRVDRAAFAKEFPSGDATATECAQNLIRASTVFTDSDTKALRRHGLSIAARVLLAAIEGAGEPLSASALADRLLVTGASITSLVDTLERKGLVRRVASDTDRRVVLVALTPAAGPVIDAYLAEVTALHAAHFACLSAAEREQFCSLLARVAEQVHNIDGDAVVQRAKPRKRPRRP